MGRYRKKPVVIEAVQYDPCNQEPVIDWLDEHGWQWINQFGFRIKTLESGDGWHEVSPGDWIIKGVKGEFYPCKPDIFDATYESAD